MSEDVSDRIDPAEIASLMSSAMGLPPTIDRAAHTKRTDPSAGRQPPEFPAALPDLDVAPPDHLAGARPYELPSFDNEIDPGHPTSDSAADAADVEVHVELGRARLLPNEEAILRDGAVIPLDKLAGDPVDILVEGRVIARGEVLVLNDKLCLRVAEIIGSPFATEMRSSVFA